MALNINDILNQMLQVAEKSLGAKWPAISDIATSEFKKLSQNIIDIEEMKSNGTISEEKAKLQIEIQKNAIKTVLLTEKGLSLLAVESAINGALGVIANVVNTAIGWSIL